MIACWVEKPIPVVVQQPSVLWQLPSLFESPANAGSDPLPLQAAAEPIPRVQDLGNSHGSIVIGGDSSDAVVRNNIIYGNSSQITNSGTEAKPSNNLCGSPGTGCAFVGNPIFANAPLNDLRLTEHSTVAIDQGSDLSAIFTTDVEGSNRPVGVAFDIGAYEFGGTLHPSTLPPTGLMAHWPLNEGSGTTVADGTGHGRTGTMHTAGWTTGILRAFAGSFSGARFVEVTDTSGLRPTEAVTISAWIRDMTATDSPVTTILGIGAFHQQAFHLGSKAFGL